MPAKSQLDHDQVLKEYDEYLKLDRANRVRFLESSHAFAYHWTHPSAQKAKLRLRMCQETGSEQQQRNTGALQQGFLSTSLVLLLSPKPVKNENH